MKKVLMVCLGNICRSPLAEGILQSKVNADKVFVDSAGTAGYHVGELPDIRSIAVAKNHGIDIANQRCRQFTSEDFETFNSIYVMDRSNYEEVSKLAKTPSDMDAVQLILNELNPGSNQEVPDPYYGGEQGFEAVFQQLDAACTVIAKKIEDAR